jgi:aconitate hydratase 2/2-methylisocitrate dehydratase
MGTGAQVYLGSAHLGAITALVGKLPSITEYLRIYNECIEPNLTEINRILNFA